MHSPEVVDSPMNSDFSPLEKIQVVLRTWWLVAVLMILGGAGGVLVHQLRAPRYEARIEFTFAIDFARTGLLTDVEEDQALEAAGDILTSAEVLEQVAAQAALPAAELQQSVTRERTASTWRIRFQRADPQEAARIANLWGEAALQALSDSYRNAITVEGLSRYLDSLESCIAVSTAVEPVQPLCSYQNLADLQQRIEEAGQELHAAKIASRGMMPGLGFQWTEKAFVPERPILYGRGSLVLAGALIGLVAAVWLQQIRQPERILRKKQG